LSFAAQYQSLVKDVFTDLVRSDLAKGAQAEAQARHFTQRGKPDFALAYLLQADLPDEEKRELLAESYEHRATRTRERAREFSQKFHRDFPELLTEAIHDQDTAELIRAGKSLHGAR
jgi:hypothetical protein